jgi:hypothetical protein
MSSQSNVVAEWQAERKQQQQQQTQLEQEGNESMQNPTIV